MRSPLALQRIVASDPVLAGWDARRRRELALTHAVRAELPRQLGARIRVSDASDSALDIVADSGAVATAVRQRLPAVRAALARDGHEFSGIRVRVQPRTGIEPVAKTLRNPIDKTSIGTIAELARTLPEGPLKTSLGRLLKRAR